MFCKSCFNSFSIALIFASLSFSFLSIDLSDKVYSSDTAFSALIFLSISSLSLRRRRSFLSLFSLLRNSRGNLVSSTTLFISPLNDFKVSALYLSLTCCFTASASRTSVAVITSPNKLLLTGGALGRRIPLSSSFLYVSKSLFTFRSLRSFAGFLTLVS